MKRLLFLLPLALFSTILHAQCPATLYVNLDSGSISKQQVNWFGFYTYYLSYPGLINIDTIHHHRNQWQVGHPQKTVFDSAYSNPNVIVTDTLHPCIPNDTSVFAISIPMLGMGMCRFSFYYKLDIDSGDIAIMEWSHDNGHLWTGLDSSGFYFPYGRPNFGASTVGWDSAVISGFFSIPGDDSPMVRFTFISDSNTFPRNGWMIDNLLFGYNAEGLNQLPNSSYLIIYPNPTSNIITVSSSDKITTISITNLLGLTICTHQYNSPQIQIDVANLPAGMYLIKINGTEVRKFVKE